MALLSDLAWGRRYSARESMSFVSLVCAVAGHRAVAIYAAVAIGALAASLAQDRALRHLAEAFVGTAISYSLVEYALHRWALHAKFWWRIKLTSALWHRLHYAHHRDPKDLTILFAPPRTSLVFVTVISLFAAGVADDIHLILPMIFCNLCAFIYYEAMHAAAHVPALIAPSWILRHRRAHLCHHHVDDRTDFGIGAGVIDWLARGFRKSLREAVRSPTVYTLGYDDRAAVRSPWVAESYARSRAARRAG